MKRFLFLLFLAAMVAAPWGLAGANTITVQGDVAGSWQPGSVDYQRFITDMDDLVTIETFTDNFDAEIFLFHDDGNLNRSDFIATDDDSGTPSAFGYNNALLELDLVAGAYIVAIGDYNMGLWAAINGINNSRRLGEGSGPYDMVISAVEATIIQPQEPQPQPVPEPATMLLLGTGLAGLGTMCRRRMKKK